LASWIDQVAHSGISNGGQHLFTLVATDVASGWTECMGVPSKRQDDVLLRAGMHSWPPALRVVGTRIRQWWRVLEQPSGALLRAPPPHLHSLAAVLENDQAHVEQKNWSIVRKVIGYDRYESTEALTQLNCVYDVRRRWTNHWQPVMKVIGKERVGAKLRKHYDVARTPYQRLRESRDLSLSWRQRLEAEHTRLAPLALMQQLDGAVMQLERLRARPTSTPRTSA
jgi:hypothetical protein